MGEVMSTAQRVAVITGASQGIGAALVQAFRSRNYKVVATSRSIKPAADSDIATVQGDVADPKTANLVFKEALDRFDRIDTLVNNAGMFMAKPFTAYSKDDYAAYMATNVTGFFHMTQRAIEIMNKQRSGPCHDEPGRPADVQRAGCACISHQGCLERRDEIARDRGRQKWRARGCSFAGNNEA